MYKDALQAHFLEGSLHFFFPSTRHGITFRSHFAPHALLFTFLFFFSFFCGPSRERFMRGVKNTRKREGGNKSGIYTYVHVRMCTCMDVLVRMCTCMDVLCCLPKSTLGTQQPEIAFLAPRLPWHSSRSARKTSRPLLALLSVKSACPSFSRTYRPNTIASCNREPTEQPISRQTPVS